MGRTRIIDCIGASDGDTAHLRLILRSSKMLLVDPWQWGVEDQAALVIVDASSLVGGGALRRTRERGIAYAQIIDADAPEPAEGRWLRRPLKRDDVIALLNGIGGSSIAPLQLVDRGDDFFDMDLGESDDDAAALPADFALRRNAVEREQDAFENLFKLDDLAAKPQFLIPDALQEGVGVEFIRGTTTRSEARADLTGNPFSRTAIDADLVDPTFRREDPPPGDTAHPLADYLGGKLLGGPARITLPGAPPLVLDPKEQVYHAEGWLPALERYAREPLRLDAWQRLVTSEIADLRVQVPARPYQRLVWMQRFVTSNGYLAKHLDPGGTYRLTKWLELAHDYPRAFRAASHMMSPLKLHEIARASDVDLAEVFDVVNAYEAIGYIEWSHRERVQR